MGLGAQRQWPGIRGSGTGVGFRTLGAWRDNMTSGESSGGQGSWASENGDGDHPCLRAGRNSKDGKTPGTGSEVKM